MSYWLLKTEPSCYSFEDLERDKTTVWDGVNNNLALKYLRQMKKGDLAFIYHTGDIKAIVGIAEVSKSPYPDPKEGDPKLAVVNLKVKERLDNSISLAQIKLDSAFQDFLLLKISRLSVMPVTETQWQRLMAKARKAK